MSLIRGYAESSIEQAMTEIKEKRALAGVRVVEIGCGTAAAYCGRLLADAGASVTALNISDSSTIAEDRADLEFEGLYAEYLAVGKALKTVDIACAQAICRD